MFFGCYKIWDDLPLQFRAKVQHFGDCLCLQNVGPLLQIETTNDLERFYHFLPYESLFSVVYPTDRQLLKTNVVKLDEINISCYVYYLDM
jgi:hypothetical protein